jgi:hypothetical protein
MRPQLAAEPGESIVELEGRRFAYSIDAHGRVVAKVEGGIYVFRQWTWGEKNRATAVAAQEDARTGQLRFDLALFNEMMLASCLEAAEGLQEICPATLRALPANLGDQLLLLAYWVNEPDGQKKKTDQRHA